MKYHRTCERDRISIRRTDFGFATQKKLIHLFLSESNKMQFAYQSPKISREMILSQVDPF